MHGKHWTQWVAEAQVGKSEDECWEVPPTPNGKRRRCWYDRRMIEPYRIVWQEANGPVAPGLYVCHTCGNGNCCNLKHLRVDTPKGNSKDALEAGHLHGRRVPRGAEHYNATLTEADVLEMRRRHAAGESMKSIWRDYPVSWPTARRAINGESWGNL